MLRFHAAPWLVVLAAAVSWAPAEDGTVVKQVLKSEIGGPNRLAPDAWRAWSAGFQREGDLLVCDNGNDTDAQRGASQTVALNQQHPEPIVASAWSRAEAVTGSADNNHALYLDLLYQDGTTLWGQAAAFDTGTHDWQRREVVLLPEKPVRELSFHLLLRGHGGKAWFRDPQLRTVTTPEGAGTFDGVVVVPQKPIAAGFQVRDVAAGSDFVRIESAALGLRLEQSLVREGNTILHEATLADTSGRDRAVTLVYAVPIARAGLSWLDDPRRQMPVEAPREYVGATRFQAGANGRLSRYPLAAVAGAQGGVGLGIDMAHPAFFRAGYNASTEELFLAYDLGLTAEKPEARLRFCQFEFGGERGFREALSVYYAAFPDAFRCRLPQQGLWMPFARISQVEGWEDFGFRFKEGDNETAWDDAHGIVTFRYTEPMTWWMSMPAEMPRTLDAALGEAQRLAARQDRRAQALLTSGYHDAAGQMPAKLLDTPWSNGAVWSMNSMPGIVGDVTDFRNKWNPKLRQRLYSPDAAAVLDGEYIDSSEGYVTDELDYRREHFAAADTPLTFATDTHRPAIFRGLIAFEYVRAISRDVHGMDRQMMANATPDRICWLAPLVDVLGTETDWHPGHWAPMSDAELLYRRALCKGKPYCFLMNTRFEEFSAELVERYMKRSLAYGMFPGFFSHNASQGHYFTRPELYQRDRPLFVKYLPLCRRVAEAGWEPVTLARSDDPRVYVERFGRRYLTVLNDSPDTRTVKIHLAKLEAGSARELVRGQTLPVAAGEVSLTLAGEDVCVLDLEP